MEEEEFKRLFSQEAIIKSMVGILMNDGWQICPHCSSLQPKIIKQRLPNYFLYLGFRLAVEMATFHACPSCMKQIIKKLAWKNIIPSNALWPLVVAPWLFIRYRQCK